ncbi:(13S,14R)-1,13-dihydroxy-N-methylcanadine 13-O-acetyltransferase AT1-like [Tripterygium wilfordii]|uniref:(13S,14R)-1,13-dihydroxy-N-methylcanadine 13-O-acetyltransferase AT1-like n=1 Tax=Tripterygium wilfordii TaxID=458696 RepID=UPI0018F8086C|nr:(13S,14R)-1,13-dihydroxy-N-methylcanadine 13-O-acetyltransferase AT1-like [Tripterygium wilfordii]
MVAFEVLTTSPEIIKPSSPTPDRLRSYKLCALDQLVDGTVYSPVWYFYPFSKDHMSMSVEGHLVTLKDSLSKSLTRFYPLAGRIDGDSTTIDCNDEGALFRQAKVSCDMDDFLGQVSSEFELLYKLLPCQLTCPEGVEKVAQVAIQANVFVCGGIALGMCLLYRIVDGTTFGAFIRAWAEIARTNIKDFGGQEQVCGSSSMFPPNERLSTRLADLQVVVPPRADEAKRNSRIKRFFFDASAISSLRSKARSENVPHPTRIEAICALFWKCLASSTASTSVFINFVNIRKRLDPPLPALSLGNIYWLAIAVDDQITKSGKSDENKKELPYFVHLLRNSIKRIDSKYLKNFQGEQGLERICKFHENAKELYSKSGLTLEVSALNRMAFYDADFGWGEPSWMTSAPSYRNEILLIETKSGDGIEASMMLDDHQLAILEHDPDFRAHTRSGQSVHQPLKRQLICNL